jgi:hypothetical protein
MPPYKKDVVTTPRSLLIVSSFKPESKCSKAYLEQQKKALESWLALGAAIVLLNKKEDVSYADHKIVFRDSPLEPPAIYDIIGAGLDYIKHQPDESVIITLVNSDIILTPDFNKVLTLTDKHNNNWAAASKRYHYTKDMAKAEIKDWGIDTFAASARVWKMVYKDMKKYNADRLRIGMNLWDSWLSGYFVASIISSKYIDLTPLKCVFHKEHPISENNQNAAADCHSLISVGAGFPSVKYT